MEHSDAVGLAALIVNPIKVDARHLAALLAEHCAAAGWADPLILETTIDDPGQGLARRALDAGAAKVFVAGGDGTVRAVAEVMDGSGVELTIVPSGTGNLLARNIRLPLVDPEDMIRAAFDGAATPIDVGIAKLRRADGSTEEHGFVVMAGMGLDAAMIANTSAKLKKRMGWVAYVDGAARSLPNAKPFRIVYQLLGAGGRDPEPDDRKTQTRLHSAKVQSILVANCGALPAGIELFPTASFADGLLDVALIQPSGPLGWVGVWRKVWWDNSVLRRFRAGLRLAESHRNTAVRYLTGFGIEIAVPEPRPVQLDGDELGEATRFYATIHPGGLLVTVPHGHRLAPAGSPA
ncbi:diacylglycerol/lipid kinase family protein [Microbacterium halophytorum]|uniref:diacylglycerol/lipid kinase family protein n=1 Tax=Microbacterium halophytorum TaxID=2067568 RepID=UPI000CFCB356|nr:diacylglycerol kinase family protein [Microbacterium halophytorum]